MSKAKENSNWDILYKKKPIKLFFNHTFDTGTCLEILGMSMPGS